MSTPRRPPLHTCAVAVLIIAHSAYTRSQDFNGPIGAIFRKISKFDKLATPVICAMQYQWLVMLSFSDNCILAIESICETIFPQSSHVFNKIDKVVQFIETMPGKFDDAVKKFTMSKDQVSLMDWGAVYAISWLNCCITRLTHWRSEEKEIIMDSKSNECNMESTSSTTTSPSPSENQYRESSIPIEVESKGKFSPIYELLPTTYKEALEKGSRKEKKGKKEDGRAVCCSKSDAREDLRWTEKKSKHHDTMEETKKDDHVFQEEDEKGEEIGLDHQTCEYLSKSDPILEMFESGWLTKSTKEARETRMSLSSSFIG